MALLESLHKYLEAPLLQLCGGFLQGVSDSLEQTSQTIAIKFAVFTFVMLVLFVAAWLPFMRSLNAMIWMTKGMLNMIPLDMITRNDKLKEKLTTGSILRYVK